MISTIAMVASIVFAVIALLAILVSVLKGFFGKNSTSLSRLIIIVGSAIVSIILTKLIAGALGKVIWPLVSSLIGQDTIAKFEAEIPSFSAVTSALASMLIAPFLFLTIFLIVRLICSLALTKLLAKAFDGLGDFFSRKRHYLGALVGVVCGILIVTVYFVPVVGLMDIATDATGALAEKNENMTEVHEALSDINNSPAIKAAYYTGGKLAFDGLTSVSVNGDITNMSREFESIAVMASSVIELGGKEIADFGAEESEAIETISNSFGDSVIVPTLAADLLSSAASAWSEGQTFIGVAAPDLGDSFDEFTADLYEVLSTTDYDTVRGDIDCVAYILCQFIDYGVLGDMSDTANMLSAISQDGLMSSIVVKLYDNERMSVLVPSVTNVGFYMLSDAIGIPANREEVYNDLMNDIASELMQVKNTTYEDNNAAAEAFKAGLVKAYKKHGVAVPENTGSVIAPGMLVYFAKDNEVTGEEVADFFAKINASIEEAQPTKPVCESSGVVMLSGRSSAEEDDIIAAIRDQLLYGNSEIDVLDEYDMVNDYTPSEGDSAGVAQLGSVDTMQTSKVTAEDLKVTSSTIPTDEESKRKDAENLENLMKQVAELQKNTSGSDLKLETVAPQIGGMLDSMAGTTIIGEDKTKDFLSAVLQSNSVSSSTGWTPDEAGDIADKLGNNASSSDGGYQEVMGSVGDGAAYIQIVLDETKTVEEREKALHDLLIELNRSSVDSINAVITPSLLVQKGASEENATHVVEAINLLLENMIKAKEDGMTEDKYASEVAAIDSLVMIALSNKNTTSNDFFGENGATGATSDQVIAKTVNSSIVSATLRDFCYDENGLKANPLNINVKNEAEIERFRTDLLDRYNADINNYPAGSAERDNFAKTINALATLMNIDPIA